MKYLTLIFLIFSFSVAAKVSLISHDGTSAFNYPLSESHIGSSIGEVTLEMFNDYQIPYLGSEQGFNSILNSPVGLDALVVVSDLEMKSYGWCYSVNGIIPELYPNEVIINSTSDEILWFWGYAHYLNGEWISQCER